MNKPNYSKTPLSLALAGLCFSGFNNAQADSFDEWGFWSGGGAPNGGPGGGADVPGGNGGLNGGDPNDQSGPLGDDIFDTFVAGLPGPVDDETPNPFAFEDPPTGTWDIYASNGYAGTGTFSDGVVATGTLVLGPSTHGNEGSVYGDGVINAMLTDMENPGMTDVVTGVGDAAPPMSCENACVFVGNDETGDQFVPFVASGEGIEGSIDTEGEPGDIEDMADFFADGSIETAADMITTVGSGGEIGPGNGIGPGVFVTGQRTPSADVQMMNIDNVQANFQGSSFFTQHSVSIDVSFGGQSPSWNGSFTDGAVNNHEGAHDFNASGGFDANSHGVSNSISGDSTAGTVIFSFFGPQAAKLGGNMDVTGPGDQGMTHIQDTFSALQGGDVIEGGFENGD